MPQGDVWPVERGKTEEEGRLNFALGTERWGEDADDRTSEVNSNAHSLLKLVENQSGGALLPGRRVKYTAAGHGKDISGYAGDGERADGVVDHWYDSNGVADNAKFWMVVSGECEFVSDGSGTLAAGDIVVGAASGKVKKQNASPGSDAATLTEVISKAGVVKEQSVAATDGTAFKGIYIPH